MIVKSVQVLYCIIYNDYINAGYRGFVTGELSMTDTELVTGNIKQLAIRCTGKGGDRMDRGLTGCRASP